MTKVPFAALDGIVGLGLNGLAMSPLFNFARHLVGASGGALLPQFSLNLGPLAGELQIGGHDTAHLAAPLQWFPVVRPEDGYWQVEILDVRVGDRTLHACQGGCR